MNLDEGMPAPKSGRRPTGRRPVRWKIPAAIAGVTLTGVLAASALVASNGGMNATTPAPAPAATSAPAVPHGHDQTMAEVDPTAWSTLIAFWSGWSNESAKTRNAVFATTATKGLAEGLADTNPYKMTTVRQPIDKVEIAGAGPYSAEFRVHFRGTTTGPVRVILVADPEAESGWLVSSIEQIGA